MITEIETPTAGAARTSTFTLFAEDVTGTHTVEAPEMSPRPLSPGRWRRP